MPIASLNHQPDLMPDLGVRILLADMLHQIIGMLGWESHNSQDIREGLQAVEYELMPFYRECPKGYNHLDTRPAQWWSQLAKALMTPWVNIRFELLERQGVWDTMVEEGSLSEPELNMTRRVADLSRNPDVLAEARLPLLNCFDALMERTFYRPLKILSFDEPLDEQLHNLGRFVLPLDFIVEADDRELLAPPAGEPDNLEDEDDLEGVFDEPLDNEAQVAEDLDDDEDPFARSGDPELEELIAPTDGESDDDDYDGFADDRWAHQQDLLLSLTSGSVKQILAHLDTSVFQPWQATLINRTASRLLRLENVAATSGALGVSKYAQFMEHIHPYTAVRISDFFYSMHLQLAVLAILSNGNLDPFDDKDRQQRGERLLEVIEDEMFLNFLAYMDGAVYRMELTSTEGVSMAGAYQATHH